MRNIVGALDVVIKAPADHGSAFVNYKNKHSIVLLAMVDENYNFTYIHVGVNCLISDGGVYWESDISKAFLNIPEDIPLPGEIFQFLMKF